MYLNNILKKFIILLKSTIFPPTVPLDPVEDEGLTQQDYRNLESFTQLDFNDIPTKIEILLKKHEGLFADQESNLGLATQVKHHINIGHNAPINQRLRRTPESLQLVVKTKIEVKLNNKIIRESHSPFAAAIVMVPKKDGEMRMCIDHRALNKITVKDKYPLPRIDGTIDALCGSVYFLTLDLLSGYWQIKIEESDKHKTAFICEFGQYEFNRMPFGLTNAPRNFQRAMNNILKTVLYKFALVYLDDIIVFSNSISDHVTHLEAVFRLFKQAGLKLKRKKCEFFKEELDYLGYIVSGKGITPSTKKLDAIIKYPIPKNVKELSSFLGLARYYRKFIWPFADKAHPLTALTRKSTEWKWGEEQRDAFECIKNCLITRPVLGYPDFSREFIIYTDASGYGIGASDGLELRESDGVEVVIAYTSKHLNDREAKWSTTDKEAHGIIHPIDVLRTYLYGRKFTVVTDHRPLEWLMSKTEPAGRLARWALKIQEFDIIIGYWPGRSHQNADTLSRTPIVPLAKVETSDQSKDTEKWIELQLIDEYCRAILQEVAKANPIYMAMHAYRRNKYVKSCLMCNKRKSVGGSKAPLHPLPLVEGVWERIAMDIVGPVQESAKGCRYVLVIPDYASRFVFTNEK
ncbi:Uncharacterized protein APZ42_031079 [Daphnia magna]|uniref:RNA-directed DNA polymerase n=1 Tax=Daphnia magna TaxID=35525 RepID=A0A164N5U3_9CRUS|nr:Uncharacterized protein APZ42_031079 [Daphnia magna]